MDKSEILEVLAAQEKYEGQNRRLLSDNQGLREEMLRWKRIARYDDLTNLMRRGTFETLMNRLVTRSRHTNTPISYILFDIDHFKKINDSLGHDGGDKVLQEVSYLLNGGVRVTDVAIRKFAGRIGGEEIALVLPNTTQEGARIVAERLRRSIEDHFKGTDFPVTVSAGVSTYDPEFARERGKIPQPALETAAKIVGHYLYVTADSNLYQAKSEGRNRVVW